MLAPWKKSYDQPRQHIKKQIHYFANKGPSSQSYDFSSSHVWMWELDYKESWMPKNWCFWTVVLEKTLESPLDCKEIQPVHPKGNQCWIFIGRTDAEAETPILWPPDVKWLIWKYPDAGKDWRWEKGTTEDEMIGWTWIWASSRSWHAAIHGVTESDTAEQFNWTELWLVKLRMLLSLGLDWPGPLHRLKNLKILSPSYLRCCKSCTHSRQSLLVTPSQGSVQAG